MVYVKHLLHVYNSETLQQSVALVIEISMTTTENIKSKKKLLSFKMHLKIQDNCIQCLKYNINIEFVLVIIINDLTTPPLIPIIKILSLYISMITRYLAN